MRRRRQHDHLEEHENHERWLVSYADFITLLFAFFVVMYSISSINEGKYRVLSDALGSAFRLQLQNPERIRLGNLVVNSTNKEVASPLPSNSIAPDLQPIRTAIPRPFPTYQAIARSTLSGRSSLPLGAKSADGASTGELPDPLDEVMKRLREALAGLIQADLVAVQRRHLWVEIEIKNNVLFSSGSAAINKQALEPLNKLAAILKDIHHRIQVEGFTDNVPINTPVYPSNWELSAARAASVVHVLMNSGVRPERMAAVGYGEFHPVGDNSTQEGRNRNRRVVLVILDDMKIRREIKADADASEAGDVGLLKAQSNS